jgi:CheY-like chemotaxis protein
VALVLALEPDSRQAGILKRVMREHVHADLVVVDSRDAAIGELALRVPDVILLTALLSPRDEEELVNHLRTLPGAEHVQTHTIPQLAGSADPEKERGSGGLLGRFLRKKEAVQVVAGWEPSLFAEEIQTFLQRAADLKNEVKTLARARPTVVERRADRAVNADEFQTDPGDRPFVDSSDPADRPNVDSSSAWSSPFEWRRSDPAAETSKPVEAKPPSLVSNVPLAVFAEEQEQRAAEETAERERLEAESAAERQRLEAEAEAEHERQRLEEEAEEHERQRLQAEAAERERQRLEAEAAERERQRLEAEAAERERQRLEAEAAERERKRLEAEAAERERKRNEAEAAAERERLRKEAEERERKRKEAEAAERERKRLEAEAAERERKRKEAEAAERKRKEAEAAAERERLRKEAERKRLEAEAAERERKRKEAEAERERFRKEAER